MAEFDALATSKGMDVASTIVYKHMMWELYHRVEDWVIFDLNLLLWRKTIRFSQLHPIWVKLFGADPAEAYS